MGGSDSVELKLTVPDSHQRSTGDALGIDPLKAEIRQVVYFDTPDLALDKVGLVVRARRMQGGAGDTVVKIRPVVPENVSAELRKSEDFKVEVDAMPGGFVCSASMKGTSDARSVRRVVLGRDSIGSLFSSAQKEFMKANAPEGVRFRDLRVLGPINTFRLKVGPAELGRKLTAEMWLYPDGSRILELSTKCTSAEAFQVAAETRSYLTSHGVDLSGEQATKTKTALQYFAAGLADQTSE
jgi:hypothetical protein